MTGVEGNVRGSETGEAVQLTWLPPFLLEEPTIDEVYDQAIKEGRIRPSSAAELDGGAFALFDAGTDALYDLVKLQVQVGACNADMAQETAEVFRIAEVAVKGLTIDRYEPECRTLEDAPVAWAAFLYDRGLLSDDEKAELQPHEQLGVAAMAVVGGGNALLASQLIVEWVAAQLLPEATARGDTQ
ncbi:hypothetical protein CSA80_03785 [Candidatus Saccharibacteria bacterium]|nr:MAG: hypothetical protein CSA80_03785 [Candidatus Saccharibacteria bacterium]